MKENLCPEMKSWELPNAPGLWWTIPFAETEWKLVVVTRVKPSAFAPLGYIQTDPLADYKEEAVKPAIRFVRAFPPGSESERCED